MNPEELPGDELGGYLTVPVSFSFSFSLINLPLFDTLELFRLISSG